MGSASENMVLLLTEFSSARSDNRGTIFLFVFIENLSGLFGPSSASVTSAS